MNYILNSSTLAVSPFKNEKFSFVLKNKFHMSDRGINDAPALRSFIETYISTERTRCRCTGGAEILKSIFPAAIIQSFSHFSTRLLLIRAEDAENFRALTYYIYYIYMRWHFFCRSTHRYDKYMFTCVSSRFLALSFGTPEKIRQKVPTYTVVIFR